MDLIELSNVEQWTDVDLEMALRSVATSPDWTLDEAVAAATLLVESHRRNGINIWVQHHPDQAPKGNLRNWSGEQIRTAMEVFRMKAHLTKPDRYLLAMLMDEVVLRGMSDKAKAQSRDVR